MGFVLLNLFLATQNQYRSRASKAGIKNHPIQLRDRPQTRSDQCGKLLLASSNQAN